MALWYVDEKMFKKKLKKKNEKARSFYHVIKAFKEKISRGISKIYLQKERQMNKLVIKQKSPLEGRQRDESEFQKGIQEKKFSSGIWPER